MSANVENLFLIGAAAINGTGNSLNNIMTGNSANNILNGGVDADTYSGGLGNDTYVVDNASDVVTEALDQGFDLVQSSINYTLVANVENLSLIGAVAINGIGNALDNIIVGNGASNVLDGLAGVDNMSGGGGNDTYLIDNALDIVIEAFNQGIDQVQTGLTFALTDNVENLTLTGAAGINGTGNALGNILIGNSANNILNGGAGADSMVGGSGNDIYVVDNVLDTVTETLNEGIDTIQSSVSYSLALFGNVENITLTGAIEINGIGNSLNNSLVGNNVANLLDGSSGNDTLFGKLGNDILTGGVGLDTFVFVPCLIHPPTPIQFPTSILLTTLLGWKMQFFLALLQPVA